MKMLIFPTLDKVRLVTESIKDKLGGGRAYDRLVV